MRRMKIIPDTTRGERDWPIDFMRDNGHYSNSCCGCGREFTGHKRRVVCRACTESPPEWVGPALEAVIAERNRQQVLGFTPEYDDRENVDGDLERALGTYSLLAALSSRPWGKLFFRFTLRLAHRIWPFRSPPQTRVRHPAHQDALITAAALSLAALERAHRKEGVYEPVRNLIVQPECWHGCQLESVQAGLDGTRCINSCKRYLEAQGASK